MAFVSSGHSSLEMTCGRPLCPRCRARRAEDSRSGIRLDPGADIMTLPRKSDGKETWRNHVYTAAELQRKTFPPVSYCVPI